MNGDSTPEVPEISSITQPSQIHEKVKKGTQGTTNKVPDIQEKQETAYIAVTLVKLIVYLLYIVVVCIITFGSTTPGSYFLTKVVYELFIDAPFEGYRGFATTFRTSSTINDFWAFTESAMLRGLYRDEQKLEELNDPDSDKLKQMYDNRMVGRARLRQLRMVQGACPATTLIAPLTRTCFPEYNPNFEEMNPFHRLLSEHEGWMYNSSEELNGTSFWGSLKTYSGGGSTILLNTNTLDTKTQLFPLKNNLWITRATRAVFLDFTFFNPNIDVFCTVKLAWEMPATGGVTTSWDIQIIELVRYTTPYQKFILICEIIFVVYTGYYIIQETLNMRKLGFKVYVSKMWSWLSILILTISIFCIQYSFYRFYTVNEVVEKISVETDKFVDFQRLGLMESIFNDAAACCIFLIWIKLFKYLSFNRSMSQLSGTLARSATELGGFAIIFLVVFMAFAQLGHVLFGTLVLDFSTFGRTIFTLLRFILGDFNYRQVEDANRLLGPIFFLSYIVFVFMILLNMFLAIINDSYQAVREEIETKGNKIQLSEFGRALTCCKKPRKSLAIVAAKSVNDIFIDPTEIKNNLRKKKFSDVEIEMFLARFDIDDNDYLDTDEAHKLLSDVTRNNYRAKKMITRKRKSIPFQNVKSLPINTAEQTAQAKKLRVAQLEEIVNRVGVIETTVVGLMPRIDQIFSEISELHRKKTTIHSIKKMSKESYEVSFS